VSYISGKTFSIYKAAFLQLTSPSAMLWGTETDSHFTIKFDKECALSFALACATTESELCNKHAIKT